MAGLVDLGLRYGVNAANVSDDSADAEARRQRTNGMLRNQMTVALKETAAGLAGMGARGGQAAFESRRGKTPAVQGELSGIPPSVTAHPPAPPAQTLSQYAPDIEALYTLPPLF